jgi:flagellar biosynthesis protein FliQ
MDKIIDLGREAILLTLVLASPVLAVGLVVALIVGILSSYAILLFPFYELCLIFLIMAVVLMVKPQGLFGR